MSRLTSAAQTEYMTLLAAGLRAGPRITWRTS